MIGMDTNVLIRYLMEDDEAQTDRVHQFLDSCRTAGEAVHLSTIVLCEAAWVLGSVFAASKSQVLGAFDRLLDAQISHIESETTVRRALDLARAGKGGIVDHLIGLLNLESGCHHTVTFDRVLGSASGFSQL